MAEKYHSNGKEVEAFYDPEVQKRFTHLVTTGQRIFTGSPLLQVNADQTITSSDLELIRTFHQEASPQNPQDPWRVQKEDRPQAKDASFYANWELPNGPLESIELASEAASFLVEEIKKQLKSSDSTNERWLNNAVAQLQAMDPNHAAAAGALHDEGRLITHQFGVNEFIGNALLKKIGIRKDIREVLPDERVMLARPTGKQSKQEAMDEMIQGLEPEAVIVRLADEFGKREPSSKTRLYLPADYTNWDRQTWANRYMNNPRGGRPTDDLSRANMQLHVDNVPFYFESLDRWIKAVSNTNLEALTEQLGREFNPKLRPIQ